MNMSYCRFHNTLLDLQACLYDLEERGGIEGEDEYGEQLSESELRAAIQLMDVCEQISQYQPSPEFA